MPKFGLLGRHLTHSYSPMIHRELAGYDYGLFALEPEEIPAFFEEGAFQGINVTIPYKKTVIPYLDELSPTAREIGSVNTIVRRPDGSLYGDNTDAVGFAQMADRSGISVEGKKVLVLGSGGASLTACYVLRSRGAREVLVISRSGEHTYETISRHADAQVIVNTTPVGMYPDVGRAPVDLGLFKGCEGVLDLIYNPSRTKLLLDAEAMGFPCAGGLSMLVWQAKAAAAHFTGQEIEEARGEAVLGLLRRRMENLILIGMPGSGKSTVGAELAALLDLNFADSDAYIEQEAGCSIPQIFEQEGEEGFRKRESRALQELGKQGGLVIATGGGCVTREENYGHLRQNGTIVFLERELTMLPTDGRPLSQTGKLAQMYKTRLPLYRRFADRTVKNDAAAQKVAARIVELVYETSGD